MDKFVLSPSVSQHWLFIFFYYHVFFAKHDDLVCPSLAVYLLFC